MTRFFRLSTIVAAITLVLIVIRAVRTVDPYWDTLAYHWAFAARVAGLCDRDCFLMPSLLEARYEGFPLVLDAAQGWIWRLAGTPAAGDLVNVVAVAALCLYMRWRFEVPLAWCWLALIAVPELQIQLTSSYIDVAANAMATIGVVALLRIVVDRDADHRADIAIALAALGIAVGGKFLMVPVALLAWTAIVLFAARSIRARAELHRRGLAVAVALALCGVIVLMPKLASNVLAFGNPFYPFPLDIGPLHLAGIEPVDQPNMISDAWKDSPRWLRWLASVVEFDAFRGRPLPWLIGQGDVPQSSPSFRMGGYFVAYVLGLVLMLSWSARRSPRAIAAAVLMIGLTLLCMALPNSSDLRYYLFWMMTLACVVLAAAYSPIFASVDQPSRRRATQALVAISLVTVVSMTGAAFLRTSGPLLSELLTDAKATVATIPDDATLCILHYDRRAILYARVFHPGRRYHVHQLQADETDPACTTRVALPP